MGSAELNADNEGEIALSSSNATNDVCRVLIPVRNGRVLGDSCTRDESRHCECDEDGFDVHLDETEETGTEEPLSERQKRLDGF